MIWCSRGGRRSFFSYVRGLCWSPDARFFASGGNDNLACVFDNMDSYEPIFKSRHNAAVKALAFCPFEVDVLAVGKCGESEPIGGELLKYHAGAGSQDQRVKFFNTRTRNLMRSLNTHAQVTGIFWSSRYREFALTLGYARIEGQEKIKGRRALVTKLVHRMLRVKVYTWPDLQCIIAIPLPKYRSTEPRAIYAVPSLEECPRFGVRNSEDLIVASRSVLDLLPSSGSSDTA